jgi:uncharacterized repeat protein (TIGR01451 family)
MTAVVALTATLLATVATATPAAASHGYEIIRTVAGNGTEGSSGDGGPATEAALAGPFDVSIDTEGNFYIAELFGNRVRKVDTDGIITTVAGDGTSGQCDIFDPECNPFEPPADVGDGGAATEAQLNQPTSVVVDPGGGSLYIAESNGHRIRRVDLNTGIITTVAGTGAFGFSGDGGPATEARLASPNAVALDDSGNLLYIADGQNQRIRVVDLSTGIITTFAGTGEFDRISGEGGPATEAIINFPVDVDVDSEGNVYIAVNPTFLDDGGRVFRVDATTGIITTVAGSGARGSSGDGGPALEAAIQPQGLAVDDAGDIFISDGDRIRRVDAASGIITTVAGGGTPEDGAGDDGPPTEAALSPRGLDVDQALGILVADLFNNTVRQIVAVPDLLLTTKTDSPDPVNVGEELTYTITVENRGEGPATGVTVTDTLPAEVDFVSASATQGSCAESGGTVTCDLGELPSDASAIVTLVVAPTTPATIANTAAASANEDDPFPGNDSAVIETSVGDVGCGQVVTRNTQLTEDIGPCPGNGVIIGKDAVTLDLGGHRIFGFEGPGDGTSAGIRLPARFRVRIQNGTVSGFDAGVVVNGGGGNTISGMEVRDNVGPDDPFNAELGDGIVVFDSQRNRIIDNVVVGNGIFDGIGVLGADADGNLIQGNTVEGTIGPSDGGPAGQGIIVNGASDADSATIITGTRTFDNVVRGSGSAGIANINNTRARIERNVVEGNGLTNAQGNGIGVQMGLRGENLASQVLVKDNQVHGNGLDGIQIRSRDNRIIDNDAANNNALGLSFNRGYDLHDTNRNPETQVFDCDANGWRGNTWGSGFYFPACVTAGGSGPPLPAGPEGPLLSFENQTCFDGIDNDQDGLTDSDDPDCAPPEGPFGSPACSDGIDNDNDGLTDSDDPGCAAVEGPFGSRACSDGIDNDNDGLIDADDPGCQERGPILILEEAAAAAAGEEEPPLPPTRQAPELVTAG